MDFTMRWVGSLTIGSGGDRVSAWHIPSRYVCGFDGIGQLFFLPFWT